MSKPNPNPFQIPFQVYYPQPKTVIKGPVFAAFGVSDFSPDDVVAFLHGADKKGNAYSQMGRAATNDLRIPLWVALFDAPKEGAYVIDLHHRRHCKKIGSVTGFSVSSGKKKYAAGPTILYPLGGATVPNTFTAYGYTDDLTDTVTATMTGPAGTTPVTGTLTFTPTASAPYWMFQFNMGGQSGAGWTLTVTQGTYVATAYPITVSP